MAASCGDLEIAKQTQNEWIFCGRKGKGRRKGNGRENEGHLRHVQSKRNLEFCCNFTLCLVASFPGIKTEQLQELVAELQLVQQSLPLLVEKTFCWFEEFCINAWQRQDFLSLSHAKAKFCEVACFKTWNCRDDHCKFVKTTSSSRQCAANDTHLLQVLQVQGLVLEHHQPQQGARHLQPRHFQQALSWNHQN